MVANTTCDGVFTEAYTYPKCMSAEGMSVLLTVIMYSYLGYQHFLFNDTF